ncbi:hypothetical protein J2861_003010 [Agrobacterium tumefaciens]|nr:hypothetical protein [Agrobacterium tumefaciens]
MKECTHPKCNVPDVSCHLGEDAPVKCKFWQKGANATRSEDGIAGSMGTESLFPWSGTAMGVDELAFLTGRGEPRLVALVGAHNAGKTTLLAAWYQLIGRCGYIDGNPFAGSFTLEGWEAVAHNLRWEGNHPSFPAHTPSGVGRAPGMLHLAYRESSGELCDVLFADSPGEWFQRWAAERDTQDAAGARWLAERASCFLITADCEILSGDGRGPARSALLNLIRRVGSERGNRPVALVWTKADIAITDTMRSTIRDMAKLVMPDIVEFSTSVGTFELSGKPVKGEDSLQMVLNWAIERPSKGIVVPAQVLPDSDPFFNYGSA